MHIVSLSDYKDNKIPHMTGEAHCLHCHNTWIAVAPVGNVWIECPNCNLKKAAFMHHITTPEKDSIVWTCGCGNQLYYKTQLGLWCPNCGSYQNEQEI